MDFSFNFILLDFHVKVGYNHIKFGVVNPSLDSLTVTSKITSDAHPFGVLKGVRKKY